MILSFHKKVALQIAGISLLLACIASPLAWYVARENAEENLVEFAMEESHRLLMHQPGIPLHGPEDVKRHATEAAHSLTGGLFEIAEIYDVKGAKLAEGKTDDGERLEALLPHHTAPQYAKPYYESRHLPDGLWTLRVFVPLERTGSIPYGYFEGVRLVPEWQNAQIRDDAFSVALMVGLASLLCGGILYPVVIRLNRENEHKAQEILTSHLSMMEALGRAIARRDSDTGIHNYRVAWMAAKLAEATGVHGSDMQALIAGSFLHDAGKIGVPDAILLKPGKLTDEEMQIMRTHVNMGEEIISGAGWLDGAKHVVASHHEKWDGSGYPKGESGTAIPLPARIFAIVDVFDALCSKRPYKAPMSLEAALQVLREGAGTHFDPALLARFVDMAPAIFQRLAGASEEEIKSLMADMVHRHFD
ncbi:HD-GYP domain-containing protein [Leeia oryzae]|uniref:HD-GYP domain-containing protein n=1 Tax=Leeia oryzae TaxID=356662 RepID=UPI00036C54FD|nr:HD domain-containing phosphohydrolase [Leeia oryzae]